MRLVSFLLPLLCLTRCHAFQCSTTPYSNQIPEITVCSYENRTDNPQNDVRYNYDCEHMSLSEEMLELQPCDAPGRLPSALCWRLRDSASGLLEVTFPLLPSQCNFTKYELTLFVHEGLECPVSKEDFKKHSTKEVAINTCSEAACRDKCSQNASVVFRYVFSACYQLNLITNRHFQRAKNLQSRPVTIQTEYLKTPITSEDSPVLYLGTDSSDGMSMQANLAMKPVSSHLELYSVDMTQGEHSCRNKGLHMADCTTCLGSSDIPCKSSASGRSDSKVTCSYQEESVVRCKFLGLKPGNYCIRIQFHDERCISQTVWDTNDYSPTCTWEQFHEFITESEARPVSDHPGAAINPYLLTLLVFALIGACSVIGFLLYWRGPNKHRFLPIPPNKAPAVVCERPTVLLLYARDCPPFMQAVALLRSLMRRTYNCQVRDCWEDGEYDAVAQSPGRWLLGLLSDPRVQVMLVTSAASAVQEASLVHSAARPAQYCQPRAFDVVLTHALSSLHETSSTDMYKRLFIVRLDTGDEGPYAKMRTYLNPLTMYILPVHLNKLMSTLHNVDSSSCVITADRQTEEAAFVDAVTEYRRYITDQPRYVDALLLYDPLVTAHHVTA